ncbi:MAG TPA: hypothetical protein VHT27_03830, partial [Solirubrobacteraceae bacterium]|nr:hypothetical protein [Solirubrobacteraceae bacterium]
RLERLVQAAGAGEAPPASGEDPRGLAPPPASPLASGEDPRAPAPPSGEITPSPAPPSSGAEASPSALETEAAPPEAPAQGSEPTGDGSLESVTATWAAVVDLVRGENGLLGALIAEARPVAVQGGELILAFASTAQFLKKKAEDPSNRMTVSEALRAVTGSTFRISYELREVAAEPGAAVAGEEDWVRRFIDEFDAEELDGDFDPAAPDSERRALTGNEKGA